MFVFKSSRANYSSSSFHSDSTISRIKLKIYFHKWASEILTYFILEMKADRFSQPYKTKGTIIVQSLHFQARKGKTNDTAQNDNKYHRNLQSR